MPIIEKLVRFCIHHRWPTIIASLLLCALLIPGIGKIQFSTSYKDYLSRDNSTLRLVEEIETTYSNNNNIFVMLQPKQGEVFTVEALSAIRAFTEEAWTLPYVKRVDSITNYQYTRADGDDLIVSDLVENPEQLNNTTLSELRKTTLGEVELVNYLISADGRSAGINIDTYVDDSKGEQVMEATEAVARLQAEIESRYPNIETHHVGMIAISNAWLNAATTDVKIVLPAAIATIFIGLAWFFGALAISLATLALSVLAIIYSLGIIGFTGGSLVPMTASSVIMILILAFADAVHIVSTAGSYLAQGVDRKQAIEKSVLINFKAIALTSITTAVGFVFFNLSEFAGLRTLGNLVAIGVMLAFVFSITLFPAMASLCKLKPSRERIKLERYEQFGRFVLRSRKLILAGFVLITLTSAYLVEKITIDDGMAKYLSIRTQFRQDLAVIEKDLTGSIMLMYNIKGESENTANDPEFMNQVDKLASWFREQPEVRYVSAYTDIMRRLNQNMNYGSHASYTLPQTRELASQYLLLYELSLPFGLDLTNRINMDKSGTLVTVVIDDVHMDTYFDLNRRAVEWMEQNMPSYITESSGPAYTMAVATEKNFYSMLESALMALIIVVFTLMISLRSFSGGLVCGLGIVIPLLMSFAIWYLLTGTVGVAESMVIGMVIGITVDNTVHFMTKYLRALKEHHDNKRDSIIYAFKTVGEPLFINTVALGFGFLLLAFSNFTVYFTLGVLTAITIVLALVVTFSLIPAVIMIRQKEA